MTHRSASADPGDAGDAADAAARQLLRCHLEARDYHACVAAAGALALPAGLAGAADLIRLAALAVARSFALLPPALAGAVDARMASALNGEADAVLQSADADSALAWCTAAAEWCERNGLDRPFSAIQARAAVADARPDASPVARVHWRIASAWHHESFGRVQAVASLLDEALALAEASSLPVLQAVVRLKRARLALYRADPAAAVAGAAWVTARAAVTEAPLWHADAADIAARAALIDGDLHRALHQARQACALADLAGAPGCYTLTYRTNEAYALMGLGAWGEAIAALSAIAAEPMPPHLRERVRLLADLAVLLRADRAGDWGAADDEALAALIGRLRALDWPGVLAVLPRHLARLWGRALEAGIETDWIRASIRARGLPPPEPSWPAAWPWPVRVQVLGTLQLGDAHGPLPERGGKAAARPLALLRRIAADGGHDGLPAELAAEALWPGEGREGRQRALEITLARLRRLLGAADAVLLHERRLRLNPACVWLDRAALERALDRLAALPAPSAHERERLWSSLLALWRGPLLADEGEPGWLLPLRLRLRLRMAAALLADAAVPGHATRRLRALAADPGLQAVLDGAAAPGFGAGARPSGATSRAKTGAGKSRVRRAG